jgi:esterase/lipase superfamily enzyme
VKTTSKWYSARVGQEIQVVRWGQVGKPVLLFPTAGGDAEEVERFLVIRALAPLMDAGRIKIYSCDSVAGRAWLSGDHSAEYCAKLQNGFDAFVYHELVPAIRRDCRSSDAEVIATGASIGAFNAVAAVCRHPDVFSHAIGMSGTYDPEKYLRGEFHTDLYFSSPMHFLPRLEGPSLDRLRERFVILTHGQGRWEDPGESWRMADVLGSRAIPNRVDAWGPEWDHDWPTWRAMLPRYLEELT